MNSTKLVATLGIGFVLVVKLIQDCAKADAEVQMDIHRLAHFVVSEQMVLVIKNL